MTAIERITAGIDWLTTTIPNDAPHWSIWLNGGLHTLDKVVAQGYELTMRDMSGYAGASASNCFVGSRDDSHIIQMSGHHANDHFDTIYRPDAHIARIDVQVSITFPVMPKDIAQEAYKRALATNELLPAQRRRKVYIVSGSDGGDTCYIGAPSSDQRGRIYNKEVQSESPDFVRTWRYEITFRNDLAGEIARHLASNPAERPRIAAAICYEWFLKRGTMIPGITTDDMAILPSTRSLPTDVERKLEWLRRQVAPTVRYLSELGFDDVIRDILQLPDRRIG